MSIPGVFKDDDLHYMPDVHRAASRRGRRFAYVLTFVTFAFVVVMIFWANGATIDEVTRGEGRVVPSSKTQVVQNLEGGILSEILVREGDIVQEGAVLVRIDNSLAEANLRDLQGQYISLQARVARLDALFDGAETVEYPTEVVKKAPDVVQAQNILFGTQRRQNAAQLSILESQRFQREQEIQEAVSQRRQYRNSLALAREELGITEPLVRQGIMPRLDLIRIERQVSDLEGQIRTINTTIPRLQTALQESDNRIDEFNASNRAGMSDQLIITRNQLKSIKETLFASTDRVTRTEVRSPVYGTIKQLKFNTVGGVVAPGADIVEIVPLEDSLLIEAEVRPADIAFLRPGQKAIIKISAYDFTIYGGLEASLEQISADTIKYDGGDAFYRVYLRTEQNTLTRQGKILPIIPGMTATAEILTGSKTVLDYLLKPVLKARDRALRER